MHAFGGELLQGLEPPAAGGDGVDTLRRRPRDGPPGSASARGRWMLALSSASSAAEGGVLRTLVGERTSLLSGILRTADGVVMAGYSCDGRTEPSLVLQTRHTAPALLSLSRRRQSSAGRQRLRTQLSPGPFSLRLTRPIERTAATGRVQRPLAGSSPGRAETCHSPTVVRDAKNFGGRWRVTGLRPPLRVGGG